MKRIGWVAALSLLGTTLVAPAQASFPGVNGRIVGDGDLAPSSGFFSVAPTGGDVKGIGGTGGAQNPGVSPSGRRFAYDKTVNGNRDVWIRNADGNDTRVTTNPANEYDAQWSPDGSKLVFVSDRDGNPELYIANTDGSNERRLTNYALADTQPVWSPDGSSIAFTRTEQGGTTEILVIAPDGTGERPLTASGLSATGPTWSPDGTAIAFSRPLPDVYQKGEIWRVNLNGTGLQNLTNTPDRADTFPVWSPNGERIAFLAEAGMEIVQIRSVAAIGLDEKVLSPSGNIRSIDWQALCDTCQTRTTMDTSYKSNKLVVKGRVTPAHPGGTVAITLFRKKGDRFVRVTGKRVTLDESSRYSTTMTRVAAKTCRLKAGFVGDDDHYPSSIVLSSFPC